jgi:hypothetical protein
VHPIDMVLTHCFHFEICENVFSVLACALVPEAP